MSNDRSKLQHLEPAPWSSNQETERNQTTVTRRVRPKNASRACNECQKRKIKCIGTNPCKNCQENSLYCEINDETDGRRRFALKRKVEDLEQDRELLLELIDVLRGGELSATHIFQLIRSNASLDEIRAAVNGRRDRKSHPTSITASESSNWVLSSSPGSSVSPMPQNSTSRLATTQVLGPTTETKSFTRKFMDIERLTDIPLYEVKAQPWTKVTTDDGFVSHLISLWLTWDHICRNWIDKDLFIEAMRSGDVKSLFCSPFLVNIILCQACCYSSYPEAFVNPDDLSSRGQHFYNEAKIHLEAMEGRIDLPTVQGLGILFLSTCLMGKDRIAHNYMSQTINSARSLVGRSREFIAQAGAVADGMERSIQLCVRGIFSFYTLSGLVLHTHISMPPPPKRVQLPIIHDDTDTWATYPYRSQPVSAHRNCVHNQSFDLHLIMYEVVQSFFVGEQDERPRSYTKVEQMTSSFYDRLNQWSRSLPECITEGQTWTPAVIGLHMSYHFYIITIFSFLKLHPSTPAHTAVSAQQKCISSALAIRDLMNAYRSKWRRIEYQPVEYLQHAAVCLFILLEDLDSPESRQAFVELSIVARAMARRFQLGRGIFRLIQLTARQQEIEMPEEVKPLYQDFELEWIRVGGAQQFSSSYPNFAMSMKSLAASTGRQAVDNETLKGKTRHSYEIEPDLLTSSAELDLFLKQWDDVLKIKNEA